MLVTRVASIAHKPVAYRDDVASSSPLLQLAGMDADRQRIEAALRAAVTTSDDFLTELASHLIVAGGKRLRPVMAAAVARTHQNTVSDEVILGGVSVELVQVGSLYHDDVMDEAEMRRGVTSVNAKWGNLTAILSGDFLLSKASEIAADLGVEVAKLLAQTIGRLCEGQILELRNTYNPARTVESYVASINGKTASLFSASARIGAIVAGLSRDRIDAATAVGDAYGMAFQIVDDILDLTATDEELGKPAGHYLVEGVYTLPVMFTLANGLAAGDELRSLLGGPIHGAEHQRALDIVRSGPGVAAAIEVARGYAESAAKAAAVLEQGPAATALADAAWTLIDSVSTT